MTASKTTHKSQMTKETLLPLMAGHILQHGLASASLRPLAKAAGTSDRMLIYHFGNKDDLIEEVLDYLAEVYSSALDAAMGGERAKTRQEVVARVLENMRNPAMKPFLAVWWEIVAGSARGVKSHEVAGQKMMTRLLEWLEQQMPEGDPDPKGGARYLLTLTEGAQMLSTIGHDDTAREGLLAGKLSGD